MEKLDLSIDDRRKEYGVICQVASVSIKYMVPQGFLFESIPVVHTHTDTHTYIVNIPLKISYLAYGDKRGERTCFNIAQSNWKTGV